MNLIETQKEFKGLVCIQILAKLKGISNETFELKCVNASQFLHFKRLKLQSINNYVHIRSNIFVTTLILTPECARNTVLSVELDI